MPHSRMKGTGGRTEKKGNTPDGKNREEGRTRTRSRQLHEGTTDIRGASDKREMDNDEEMVT